jgi:outer membrane protease
LPNNFAYCEENEKKREYGFTFGQKYGFIHGDAFEYVYPLPGEIKGDLLSELKWEMKPIIYYGALMDFGRIDIMSRAGFFASASIKVGLPGDSGVMEDFDWMSSKNTDLTHYSKHTNRTNELYWVDLALGASIPIKQYLYLKPFLSGSWMHFSFSARDGYTKYSRYNDSEQYYYSIDDKPYIMSLYGEVIRYKQDWLLLALGIEAGSFYFSPFSFNLSFQISPITYCAAVDDHLLRDAVFMDFTGFGLYLEPKARITYTIKPVDVSFEFAYRHIGRTMGDSYRKQNGDYNTNGEAGAGLSIFITSFLFSIKI